MRGISRRLFLLGTTGLVAGSRLAEAAADELRFLVLGDWGKGTGRQRDVADRMAKTAGAMDAQFIISTGDNFYPDGVKSVDDEKWATRFEDVYDASALMVPWYITLGNHDHNGVLNAQVAYSKLSPRWRLPAPYHKHTQLLAAGESADFFHIDTTSLIRRYPSADPQLVWLERALAASTSVWKIVVGHHPVHAGGEHGDTEELMVLKPLFERYGVQVYLNGHDHHMEHVVVGDTHYLTSGAAAKPRRAQAIKGTRFVMGKRLGFMLARLTPTVMQIEFIDDEGLPLYRGRLQRKPGLAFWNHYLDPPASVVD